MNKILLPLFAFMLSATAANAQALRTLPEGQHKQVLAEKFSTAKNPFEKKAKAPKKALASNQKYIGIAGADTPAGMYNQLSSYLAKATSVGTEIPVNVAGKYVGAKIVGMRFAVYGFKDASTTVQVSPMADHSIYQGTSASVAVQNCTVSGNSLSVVWNEVKFNTPLTIEEGKSYLAEIQTPNKNYTTPLVCMGDGATYGLWGYGNLLGQGEYWYSMSTYALPVQLIIEKDGGFPTDFSVSDFHVAPFGVSGKQMASYITLSNTGSTAVSDYVLGLYVDGQKVATFDNNKSYNEDYGITPESYAVSDAGTLLEIPMTLPALAQNTDHKATVKVEKVEGKDPSGNTSDDAADASFKGVSETVSHQKQLLEHFTSIYCTNCPNGYESIRQLMKSRNDIAWVAVHGNMQNGTDPYTINDGLYVLDFSTTGFPSASVNRYYVENPTFNADGMVGFVINYGDDYVSSVSDVINEFTDYSNQDIPAFVNLDIKSNFNDGKLTFTVTGTGVKDAAKLLNGATLTTYITQDGLTGRQANGNKWVSNYEHNNILRAVVKNGQYPIGDAITWNGDNFEMSYEYNVPKEWYSDGVDKLRLTSFVSMPFWDGKSTESDGQYAYPVYNDARNAWVNQCQTLTLVNGAATGISGVENNGGATVVARYSLDGTRISAPVKGINILKMSDGTTRKVVVNK